MNFRKSEILERGVRLCCEGERGDREVREGEKGERGRYPKSGSESEN